MHGVVLSVGSLDLEKYGNFYILKTSAFHKLGYSPAFELALVAEDFSWIDCSGCTQDIPIAYSDSHGQLILQCACNGITLAEDKVYSEPKQHIFFA